MPERTVAGKPQEQETRPEEARPQRREGDGPGRELLDTTSLDKIRHLERTGQGAPVGPGAVSSLISMFFEDAAAGLRAMRTALEDGDQEGLRTKAHSVRGSCAAIGAVAMASLIRELEQKAGAGLLAEASAVQSRLEIEYERTRVALERYGASFG